MTQDQDVARGHVHLNGRDVAFRELPGRGTPIAPPARREPPRNEITPEEAAAMAEEPGFPFGANAPAR